MKEQFNDRKAPPVPAWTEKALDAGMSHFRFHNTNGSEFMVLGALFCQEYSERLVPSPTGAFRTVSCFEGFTVGGLHYIAKVEIYTRSYCQTKDEYSMHVSITKVEDDDLSAEAADRGWMYYNPRTKRIRSSLKPWDLKGILG